MQFLKEFALRADEALVTVAGGGTTKNQKKMTVENTHVDATAAGIVGEEKGRSESRPKGRKNTESRSIYTQSTTEKVEVTLRSLLEAGVHFGHQTSRWNPAMAPYIYAVRNGIHIINLPKTVQCWQRARQAVFEIASKGGSVLFVGTKKQAQEAVVDEAKRCGAYYVSQRWLGGMITNFQTIKKSVERMKKLEETLAVEEQTLASGGSSKFTKKERLMMSRELEKLEFSLGGIRDMNSLPALLFVIDIRREDIAVKEANRLDIPVVSLVDTNCDPESVLYPIPSNDDGTRAIRLFCRAIGDAIIEGRAIYQQRAREEAEKEAQERRREKAAQAAAAAAAAQEKAAAAEKAAAEKAAAAATVENGQAE